MEYERFEEPMSSQLVDWRLMNNDVAMHKVKLRSVNHEADAKALMYVGS